MQKFDAFIKPRTFTHPNVFRNYNNQATCKGLARVLTRIEASELSRNLLRSVLFRNRMINRWFLQSFHCYPVLFLNSDTVWISSTLNSVVKQTIISRCFNQGCTDYSLGGGLRFSNFRGGWGRIKGFLLEWMCSSYMTLVLGEGLEFKDFWERNV